MIRLRTSSFAIALLLGTAAAVSGCTSGGTVLGTRDSSCFRVLPSARRDVGPGPAFAGVRHLPPGVLIDYMRRRHARVGTVPDALEDSPGAACLVAFRGKFTTRDVRQPWAPRAGPYRAAVVVIEESSDRVLATVLLRSGPTPLDFTHRFAFQR
jgi:hypothetical protein